MWTEFVRNLAFILPMMLFIVFGLLLIFMLFMLKGFAPILRWTKRSKGKSKTVPMIMVIIGSLLGLYFILILGNGIVDAIVQGQKRANSKTLIFLFGPGVVMLTAGCLFALVRFRHSFGLNMSSLCLLSITVLGCAPMAFWVRTAIFNFDEARGMFLCIQIIAALLVVAGGYWTYRLITFLSPMGTIRDRRDAVLIGDRHHVHAWLKAQARK